MGSVPADLVAACREHGVALLDVPVDVLFATVTDRVLATLVAESGSGHQSAARHRRLLSAAVEGGTLDRLLEPLLGRGHACRRARGDLVAGVTR